MPENDLSGIKSYLRRKFPLEVLKRMADDCLAAATEEVLFTANSYEGGSASGIANVPKKDLLACIEEILAEAGEGPMTGGRSLFSHPSFAGNYSQT